MYYPKYIIEKEEKKLKKITIDGNTAAATMAYAFSEVSTIYPITPSSTMAELMDAWSNEGKLNLFGKPVHVVEMQSEAGASGALHGVASSGTLCSTFTASQGLLLMIPNMYKIAGELTPCVIHCSARALATHALSIFGDHSDVMSVRMTGWAMLCASSVQEAMDMSAIAHLSTLHSSVPFVHFFDGFRTSHEINTIEEVDMDSLKTLIPYDKIKEFKARGLNPNNPHQQGTAQNPDIYFQNREACNSFYQKTPSIVQKVMNDYARISGRQYHLFDYYGDPNADSIIIMMGSGSTTAIETIEYLNKTQGTHLGVLVVRLYRPFDANAMLCAIPKSVNRIAVLDRTKECGADGEPLYKDVVCALANANRHALVLGGRYGLGSKEFTPSMVGAVFENLYSSKPINGFTIGIDDDVTGLSLPITREIHPSSSDTFACKFYGYGGDGTVSANKSSIKIIGNNTDLYGQAYFEYDSKKTGNATICHLRFGKNRIMSSYLLDHTDFVAVHNQTYVKKYNILYGLKDNGTLLLNTSWSKDELFHMMPNKLKRELATKHISVYTIDAYAIAKEIGLGNKINLVMQSAFFKLINIIPINLAISEMKAYALKSYGKKGEKVVQTNYLAIERGANAVTKVDIPSEWAMLKDEELEFDSNVEKAYYYNFISPIEKLEGNSLKVSDFDPRGFVPTNTTRFEKRGIANILPCWKSEHCIQCNMCSFVCPHAAIRPHLVKKEDILSAPDTLQSLDAIGEPNYKFVMQVSPMDCTGCGVCASVCPAKEKALVMSDFEDTVDYNKANYEYMETIKSYKSAIFKPNTVKGSQFNKPYFEFSGACAGCGETPYIKVISQLFGDRMVIANATGCSSIYGGSAPTCPYAKDENGRGIAWANSLFEDNAEFGYGIKLGLDYQKKLVVDKLQKMREMHEFDGIRDMIDTYLDSSDATHLRDISTDLICNLQNINCTSDEANDAKQFVLDHKNNLTRESMWIIGGDGWAYDIGYGGLDHILASGENVNILVLDTEVYSNTGGQASKSTPIGAIAKFASTGKRTNKKDLAIMATTYKNVYVAKVAMGADMNQFMKAITEAEKYNGVSLILAYAPCINHGIKMENSQLEEKRAVEAGYWQLFRYNPERILNNENPFILDSKQPSLDYNDFIMGENRYKGLQAMNADLAEKLFAENRKNAMETYNYYKKLSEEK